MHADENQHTNTHTRKNIEATHIKKVFQQTEKAFYNIFLIRKRRLNSQCTNSKENRLGYRRYNGDEAFQSYKEERN